MVKFGKFSLWYNVYHLVPGAQAIRAVFRFQLLLLLVMNTVIAIALNDIVDHLPYKRWINNRSKAFIHGILGLLCVFLMMEQVNHANILNYSKQQNIVMLQQIDPPPAHCKVFFVDYKTVPYRFPAFPVITAQMDAMLIAMHFHIPTLNGYSGFFPSGWWVEAQDVDASLKRWINKNNIDITTVYALNPADGKWTPCQEYLKTKRNYRLGDPISFGANGNAYFFTRKGWSNAEESFTWTEGPSAYIAIDIPPQPDNITLEMDLIPYTPDNHKQIIEVYVNKEKCGNWTALKEGIYSVAIPGHLTKTGLLSIEFVIPACISPKDAGQSNDARDLGMAVKSLRIY